MVSFFTHTAWNFFLCINYSTMSLLSNIMQFPYCDDESAMSVSCLDLCYSVTFEKLMDERDDKIAPYVLKELEEDDTDSSG